MAKRRTQREIDHVDAVAAVAHNHASEISARVNPGDGDGDNDCEAIDDYISVTGGEYHHVRAQFQAEAATLLKVSFAHESAEVIERVAWAIRSVLKDINSRTCATCIQQVVPESLRACPRCSLYTRDLYSPDITKVKS